MLWALVLSLANTTPAQRLSLRMCKERVVLWFSCNKKLFSFERINIVSRVINHVKRTCSWKNEFNGKKNIKKCSIKWYRAHLSLPPFSHLQCYHSLFIIHDLMPWQENVLFSADLQTAQMRMKNSTHSVFLSSFFHSRFRISSRWESIQNYGILLMMDESSPLSSPVNTVVH